MRGAEASSAAARPPWPARRSRSACVVVLCQPLAADSRSMAVLGHRDTREIARDWLVSTSARGLRVVVEPARPRPVLLADAPRRARSGRADRPSSSTSSSATSRRRASSTPGRCARRSSTATARAATARSSRWTSSAGARSRPTGSRAALAYYARLERESDLVFSVSPYRADATPPPFSFDLSYSYYSPAYQRPGPAGRDLPAPRLPQGVRACGAAS